MLSTHRIDRTDRHNHQEVHISRLPLRHNTLSLLMFLTTLPIIHLMGMVTGWEVRHHHPLTVVPMVSQHRLMGMDPHHLLVTRTLATMGWLSRNVTDRLGPDHRIITVESTATLLILIA
mmetsp:Transcript_14649/g.30484  ORF Transcript_14649/g.30484 Transcript_14649/m.30484 type:complete len:119 (-) Transcript_14649:1005-1361(-)